MIVRGRPAWRDVSFAVRGSILRKILRSGADRPVVVDLHEFSQHHLLRTLVGRPQAVGQPVIASRSFARQVSAFDPAHRDALLKEVCAFAAGLAARLRNGDEAAAIARHIGHGEWLQSPKPTDTALALVGRQCRALVSSGYIDGMLQSVLEVTLTEMSHVQGGCERLKTTPLPFSYSLLLHRTAYAFCLLLPFALAPSLDWWTPVLTFLVSYAFFSLNALSDELCDPFGMEPNDLPLDSMVRTIEREMRCAMGIRAWPPALEAQDYVLR